MKRRLIFLMFASLLVILLAFGCAPQTPTPVPVDVVGSLAAELAVSMMTQTAAASSPTPTPVTPTLTPTPEPVTPTETVYVATKRPEIEGFAPCWTGPGPNYTLISNISDAKRVDLLGVGSVEGWYVILNPYFNVPCWVSAEHLQIFSDIDLSAYPVMTPGR